MKTIRRHFKLGENARMAIATLREHKMRSFLTVLGVVIAVIVLILGSGCLRHGLPVPSSSSVPSLLASKARFA